MEEFTRSNGTPAKTSPIISIIVAVYNGGKTLQHCIDSVVQQTYSNKEFIIIDGGSKDGTVGLLEANQEQISYWISEPDKGIYNAWNKGLRHVTGDWVCFLGADDYFWDAEVLERIASKLMIIPQDIRVAYGQIVLIGPSGESLHAVGGSWEKAKTTFPQIMSIPHPGAMHRYSLFADHGSFDESFRIAGDYELLLRELKTREAMFIPDLITIGMRQGGISSDPANTIEAMLEIRRAQRKHGQKFPGTIWIMAMARVYIKWLLWRSLGATITDNIFNIGRKITRKSL